jgi:hypothetical protein
MKWKIDNIFVFLGIIFERIKEIIMVLMNLNK